MRIRNHIHRPRNHGRTERDHRGSYNARSRITSNRSRTTDPRDYNQRNFHDYSVRVYHQHKVIIVRGHGSFVYDNQGKAYFDGHSGYGKSLYGHSSHLFEPVFSEIMSGETPMIHGAFPKDRSDRAAERLAKITGNSFDIDPENLSVYFNNTGAEAVETALKFAKLWAYKDKGVSDNEKIIASVEGCFHGRTIGATSLFSDKKTIAKEGFGPLTPGVIHLPWNNPDKMTQMIKENGEKMAAVIIEPVQGEGGINVPDKEYMKQLADICKETNTLIIADEIQSGVMRTGPFWASEHFKNVGFVPDIITSAKALGGGMFPVAAVIISEKIRKNIEPGMHGSTFGSNNIGMAFLNRTLDILEEQNIKTNVAKMSGLLERGLSSLQTIHPEIITDITGLGMWRGIKIDPKLSLHKVVTTLIKNGVITGESGTNVLRFAPPLNVEASDLASGLKSLSNGFDQILKTKEDHIDHGLERGRA